MQGERERDAISTNLDDPVTIQHLNEVIGSSMDFPFQRDRVDAARAAGQISNSTATEMYVKIKTAAYVKLKALCENSQPDDTSTLVSRIQNYQNAQCLTPQFADELRGILRIRHTGF
jgi:hypothetical protein